MFQKLEWVQGQADDMAQSSYRYTQALLQRISAGDLYATNTRGQILNFANSWF